MIIQFKDDAKGNRQSITAFASTQRENPDSLVELSITAYGATEAEARDRILAEARSLIDELQQFIDAV